MTTIDIAKICHEVNRIYCQSLGDVSQTSWEDAPEWQKESAKNGVVFRLSNPNSPPSFSHDNWLQEKKLNGWKYGIVKDVDKKEHPCFIPYEQLPVEQKIKDKLFISIVDALSILL